MGPLARQPPECTWRKLQTGARLEPLARPFHAHLNRKSLGAFLCAYSAALPSSSPKCCKRRCEKSSLDFAPPLSKPPVGYLTLPGVCSSPSVGLRTRFVPHQPNPVHDDY